jgi:ABC-type transporter Mla MlaB component
VNVNSGFHLASGSERAHEGGRVVLPRAGPMPSRDVVAVCNQARIRLDVCTDEVVPCDVRSVTNPDATTIDALARLQLGARRRGRRIGLLDASPELRELLALVGLSEVVPCVPGSGLEVVGEAEEREPARRVEEEGDPGDPIT